MVYLYLTCKFESSVTPQTRMNVLFLFGVVQVEHWGSVYMQKENNTTYEEHNMQIIQRTDKAELAGRIDNRNNNTGLCIDTNIL